MPLVLLRRSLFLHFDGVEISGNASPTSNSAVRSLVGLPSDSASVRDKKTYQNSSRKLVNQTLGGNRETCACTASALSGLTKVAFSGAGSTSSERPQSESSSGHRHTL